MNHALADALQQLHLEPGTYRCELAEQEIVVEVRPRKTSDATRTGGIIVEAHLGKPALPDVPEIPPYDEGDDGGMLDPWVELPTPKPIGQVVARPTPPPPVDIPDIPAEDDMPALYCEHPAEHFADTYSRIGLPEPYETEL